MAKIRFFPLVILCALLTFTVSAQEQPDHVLEAFKLPHPLTSRWSPDGQHIAFFMNFRGYVMDRDGQNLRHLTNENPVGWSPDSKALLIHQDVTPNSLAKEWWLLPIDGSTPQRILTDFSSGYIPQYSPAGDQIALYGIKVQPDPVDHWALWVVKAAADGTTSESILLADTIFDGYDLWEIDWSASGDELILNLSKRVTEKRVRMILPVHEPNLPLQLSQIKVERLEQKATRELAGGWLLDFDPGQNVFFAYNASRLRHPDRGSLQINGIINNINLSTDGNLMVFVEFCDHDEISSLLKRGIWDQALQSSSQTAVKMLNLNDGTETTLLDCGSGSQYQLALSPAGYSVVFNAFDLSSWHLYRADLATDGSFTLNDITPR